MKCKGFLLFIFNSFHSQRAVNVCRQVLQHQGMSEVGLFALESRLCTLMQIYDWII